MAAEKRLARGKRRTTVHRSKTIFFRLFADSKDLQYLSNGLTDFDEYPLKRRHFWHEKSKTGKLQGIQTRRTKRCIVWRKGGIFRLLPGGVQKLKSGTYQRVGGGGGGGEDVAPSVCCELVWRNGWLSSVESVFLCIVLALWRTASIRSHSAHAPAYHHRLYQSAITCFGMSQVILPPVDTMRRLSLLSYSIVVENILNVLCSLN